MTEIVNACNTNKIVILPKDLSEGISGVMGRNFPRLNPEVPPYALYITNNSQAKGRGDEVVTQASARNKKFSLLALYYLLEFASMFTIGSAGINASQHLKFGNSLAVRESLSYLIADSLFIGVGVMGLITAATAWKKHDQYNQVVNTLREQNVNSGILTTLF